jgi:hypothetical protein
MKRILWVVEYFEMPQDCANHDIVTV